ncbi:helix-turn-helix transcriptional regulator [Flavobacterium supellecticarium]|uniref:Helix-turn-helix transcriptional regulator n=1 Tax=Flavobacterium supellecticarium TaxID=2565924 RepID=A0A4S4A1D4_9FLAO|nr:helix-turn-helix transcriptional regulator [Flavobacterium supellecticarium]THF51729.1 helix-turn-helix transcriptional regulator [Flavobacterium supellecticarium]
MSHFDTPDKKIHQGRNIKRFREMLGIKQEALAIELGEDWTQKRVSLMEQRETIENNILAQVAQILNVPVEAIENLDDEQAVNIIANTFNIEKDGYIGNLNPVFNINPLEEIKQLHEEKIALYERMLKEKEDMMNRLEQLILKK